VETGRARHHLALQVHVVEVGARVDDADPDTGSRRAGPRRWGPYLGQVPLLGEAGVVGRPGAGSDGQGDHSCGDSRKEKGERAARMGGGRQGVAGMANSTISRLSTSPTTARTWASASSGVRSGAKRWLIVSTARSGTTLWATPPSTRTAWRPSRNSQPSMTT